MHSRLTFLSSLPFASSPFHAKHCRIGLHHCPPSAPRHSQHRIIPPCASVSSAASTSSSPTPVNSSLSADSLDRAIAKEIFERNTAALPSLLQAFLLSSPVPLDAVSTYRRILAACVNSHDLRAISNVLRHGLTSSLTQHMRIAHVVHALRALAGAGYWNPVFSSLDAMSIPDSSSPALIPDARLLVVLANDAVDTGAYRQSLNLFRWMTSHKIPFSPHAYSVLLKSHGRASNVVAVKEVITRLSESRLPIDNVLLNSTIDALVRCNDVRTAHQMLLNQSYAELVDHVTYNTVIKGYVSIGQVRHAFQLASRMHAVGIEPTAATLNTLMTACVTIGDFDTAFQLFECYSSSRPIPHPFPPPTPRPPVPSPSVKRALLSSASLHQRQWDDEDGPFDPTNTDEPLPELINELQPVDSTPLTVDPNFSKPVSTRRAISKTSDRKKQLCIAMTTLLCGLLEAERADEAFQLLEDMRLRGATPNSITYSSLITTLLKKHDVDRAMNIFEAIAHETDEAHRPMRDFHVWSSLVIGLCRIGTEEYVHSAAELLQALFNDRPEGRGGYNRNGVRPTVKMMNAILEGYVEHGLFGKAEQWLATMTRESIRPTIVSYTSLMKGYADSKQYGNAKRTFREMARLRLQPDRVALNAFVSVCARSGDLQAAEKVLLYMEQRGGAISPTAQSYVPVLRLHARARNRLCLWAMYERMRSQRVPVNDFVMAVMVQYILGAAEQGGDSEDVCNEESLAECAGEVLRDGLKDVVSERVLRRSKRRLESAFSEELCRKYFGGLNTAHFRSASETIFERHGWNNIDSGWRVL